MGKRKNTRVQFGEQLRSARVAQHLSIDQVAADLRIPARHLDALEQSDVSTFSAPVYAHGALRSYAGYLGLRADTLERALSSELKTFANQTDLKVHTLPR